MLFSGMISHEDMLPMNLIILCLKRTVQAVEERASSNAMIAAEPLKNQWEEIPMHCTMK